MKRVEIQELFETGRYILAFDEFNGPQSLSDLKKCDNVEVGAKLSPRVYEALIETNDDIVNITLFLITIHHPADGSRMSIIEVNY